MPLSRRRLLAAAGACGLAGVSDMAGAAATQAARDGGALALRQQAVDEGATLPKPTPAQLEWQDCELGVVYHFDMPVAAGVYASNNTSREVYDPSLYNPAKLDTDQWLEAATAMGAKYAVFTATHFNGFLQWQSDLYPYGLKQAKWRDGKGDVVGDFVESCRKVGIRPGIYLSCHRNVYWKLWSHYVDWGKGRGTEAQERYNRLAEGMVEELCSRYGPLLELWFDAGVKTPAEGGPDVLPIVDKHQPNIVFYHSRQRADHRWIGNESGHAGVPCWSTMPKAEGELSHNSEAWKKCLANGDANGKAWSPGMVDVPLRGANRIHNWFWAPNQDHGVEPLDRLRKMYYQSVGRNSTFLVGEVVTPEGRVPQCDIDRLAEFGKEIKRLFGESLAETRGVGHEFTLALPKPQKIDHVVAMEDIEHGERIRRYRVEGLVSGGEWVKLCKGESIGHKRIEQFDPVEVAQARLAVGDSTATPMVRRLAVFGDGA